MGYPTANTYNSIAVSVKSYNFEKVILNMADDLYSKIATDFALYTLTNLEVDTTDLSTIAISMCKLFR